MGLQRQFLLTLFLFMYVLCHIFKLTVAPTVKRLDRPWIRRFYKIIKKKNIVPKYKTSNTSLWSNSGAKTQLGLLKRLKAPQRLCGGATAVVSQCYLDRLPPLPDGKYQPGRAISPSARRLWSQAFAWRWGAWRRPRTLAVSPPPGRRTQEDRPAARQAVRQADAQLASQQLNLNVSCRYKATKTIHLNLCMFYLLVKVHCVYKMYCLFFLKICLKRTD